MHTLLYIGVVRNPVSCTIRTSGQVHLLAPIRPLNDEFLKRYSLGLYQHVKLGDTFNNRYSKVKFEMPG